MHEKLSVNQKRPPTPRAKGQPFNLVRRPRGEYLIKDEIERLCRAARVQGRHGHRDATMIWTAFVHGLRVSELIDLQVEQYDFKRGMLHVRRIKNGTPSTHPVSRREAEALKKLLDARRTGHVFASERGTHLQPNAPATTVPRPAQTTSPHAH